MTERERERTLEVAWDKTSCIDRKEENEATEVEEIETTVSPKCKS